MQNCTVIYDEIKNKMLKSLLMKKQSKSFVHILVSNMFTAINGKNEILQA